MTPPSHRFARTAAALVVLAVCALGSVSCAAQAPAQADASVAPVVDTKVCEITASPDSFDRKLLRLHAFISRGFEDSTLHDPSCPEEALVNMRALDSRRSGIWADFADQVGYWKLKGFAPLVRNEDLTRFRSLLVERGRVHQMTGATMVGTFYAGKPIKVNGRVTPLRGYGHMGCCSLFVISRIESLDTDYADTLDYAPEEWGVGLPEGCYSEQMVGLPTNTAIQASQEIANQGGDSWRYDPKQVAQDHLHKLKAGAFGSQSGGRTELISPGKSKLNPPADTRPTETLMEISSAPYLKRYEWIEPDRITHIIIVVARPFWLAHFAASPEKVIWAPVGASVVCCVAPGTERKKKKSVGV